jgi:hypothetical protein
MSLMFRSTAFRPLAAAVIGVIAMLAAGSGTADASYGPPVPPVAPVPGGYLCVVTSQTVGPHGRLIAPLRLPGMTAGLSITRGTFHAPVQVTITEPYGPDGSCEGRPELRGAGHAGYWAVTGIGILVQRNGIRHAGAFARPLVLRMRSRWISARSLVVAWNGRRFRIVRRAVIRAGRAEVGVRANADFAVLSPLAFLRKSGYPFGA